MLWIDTPLVRESKAELSTFQEMIAKLPGPLKKTTSVENAAKRSSRALKGGSAESTARDGWG